MGTATPPLPPPAAPVPPPQPAADPVSCANCAATLAGPYCFRCGQHVADYHRSVWRFLTDFLDNTFCWDNKVLHTLEPLVRQPGFLTHEFMAGRRVRYVHPLRLFLFASAVCLALIGFINHHSTSKAATKHGVVQSGKKSSRARSSRARHEEKPDVAAPVADTAPTGPVTAVPLAAPLPSPSPDSGAPGKELSLAEQLQQAASASASASATPGKKTSLAEQIRQNVLADAARQSAKATPAAATPSGKDADDEKDEALEAKINRIVDHADEAVERATEDRERARKIGKMAEMGTGSEKVGQMAEAISQGVEQRLSWVALALLPVFALLLRAVYRREGTYYFSHLVFSLHYHTFLLVFWAAWACAGFVMAYLPMAGLWSFLLGWCLLLPGWYLYVALRRLYGDSPRRTVAKVFVLGSLHLLAIIIGVASVGAMAFFSAPK